MAVRCHHRGSGDWVSGPSNASTESLTIDSFYRGKAMPHFRLTHFDRVWRALGDPSNETGLAAAYRFHFAPGHLPKTPQDMAGCLNFLLSRCTGEPEVHPDDIRQKGMDWMIRLRNDRTARALEAYALEHLVPGGAVGERHRDRPKVASAPVATALHSIKRALAPISQPFRSPSDLRRGVLIQQERPYADLDEVPAPPGPAAPGVSRIPAIQQGSPYGLGHYSAYVDGLSGNAVPAAPAPRPGPAVGR